MTQSPANNPNAGGEEWRDMDGANADYNPALSADTLKQARANIESLRKGTLRLQLRDASGQPLANTNVRIALQRHAFQFGEQLWPLDALIRDGRGNGERARAWKQIFTSVFNAATNLCYWTERPRNDASKTEDQQGFPRVENFAETVDWTRAEGMTAKGHPLFWSIQKCVPEWVKRYDYPTRMKFAEVRVRNLVARFRGKVTVWDAVNEPMWEPAFKNLDQREWPHIEPIDTIADYIGEVMRWCREEDPNALFLINDYGMEENKADGKLRGNDGSVVTAASQRKRYAALMRTLLERGQAPDAIGLQTHSGWVQNHAQQWAIFDEFAQTGLPVHITEFWAHTTELKKSGRFSEATIRDMQAEYVANFLTTAFGHASVDAFYFWGFMNMAVDWLDAFSSYELRPVFHRVQQLIRKEWHTQADLRSNDDGICELPAFYGLYDITLPDACALPLGRRIEHVKGNACLHSLQFPQLHSR